MESQLKEEPAWIALHRKLEEEYARSRKQPLNLSDEEALKLMEERYEPPIKKRNTGKGCHAFHEFLDGGGFLIIED